MTKKQLWLTITLIILLLGVYGYSHFFTKNDGNSGDVALANAVKYGRLLEVKELVEEGTDVNFQTKAYLDVFMGKKEKLDLDFLTIFLFELGVRPDLELKIEWRQTGNSPLQVAAENGHLEIVKYLVENGADIDAEGNSNRTALIFAAQDMNFDMIEYLVANGADINASDMNGRSALINVVQDKDHKIFLRFESKLKQHIESGAGGDTVIEYPRNSHIKIVKYLVENGADVNAKENYNTTALTYAAEDLDFDMIKYLVEKGADVNVQGNALLLVPASRDDIEIVKYLMEKGADVNAKGAKGSTALMAAVGDRNLDMIKYLTENGADMNTTDKNGDSALESAVRGEHFSIAKYLIENGANVKSQNPEVLPLAAIEEDFNMVQLLVEGGADIDYQYRVGNRTALMIALHADTTQMAEYLVANGADVNIQAYGDTVLIKAAANGRSDLAQLFVANGADLNIQDEDGETALMKASKGSNYFLVKYLLANGADIGIQAEYGETALIFALENIESNPDSSELLEQDGHIKLIKYLIAHGADINTKTPSGQTPLITLLTHTSSNPKKQGGYIELAKYFIAHGADVNTTENTYTPLIRAAELGDLSLIKLLVEKGASLDNRDHHGYTALVTASKKGHTEIVSYLKQMKKNTGI